MEFCPTLQRMLTERTIIGRTGKVFKDLAALSTLNNLKTLQKLCIDLRPKSTLEIGLCFGGSALCITTELHRMNGMENRLHIAIDPHQFTVWDYTGIDNIKREGLNDYFEHIAEDSSICLAGFLKEGKSFDLIYVDGSHIFEDVFVDMYFCSRLLKLGGVIIFDDCTDPHVRKVMRFIDNCSVGLSRFNLTPYRENKMELMKHALTSFCGRTQLRAFKRVGPVRRPWNAPYVNF